MTHNTIRCYETYRQIAGLDAELAKAGFKEVLVFPNATVKNSGNAADLVSAIVKAGVAKYQATYFAQIIQKGGAVVLVQAGFGTGNKAVDILNKYKPLKDAGPSEPYRGMSGTPLILEQDGEYKSYSGTPLILEQKGEYKSYSGTPLLLAQKGEYQSFSGTPLLLKNKGSYQSFSGTPLLLEQKGEYKSFSGTPLLIDNPTPLSTWLGLPVLSK